MKVYLAGRYTRREELAGYIGILGESGYLVTSRWLVGHKQSWTGETNPLWTAFAMADFEDVDGAEMVISFTHPRGTLTTGGGRHAEFGYGYARGKQMIVIGERENVFHHLPGVEVYPDITSFLGREK